MPLGSQQHKNRCVYCSSVNYGKGCRFGPHGVHFHPEDSTKCSFCGSPDYGKGCRINPTNNIHVHGGTYNNMFKETVDSYIKAKILLEDIKKDYIDFECFKLGIINNKGEKIKDPNTIEECSSYSSYVKTIFKLKKYLGSKVDLLEAQALLEKETATFESPQKYQKILEYRFKAEMVVNELYKIINEAQVEGISADIVLKA